MKDKHIASTVIKLTAKVNNEVVFVIAALNDRFIIRQFQELLKEFSLTGACVEIEEINRYKQKST